MEIDPEFADPPTLAKTGMLDMSKKPEVSAMFRRKTSDRGILPRQLVTSVVGFFRKENSGVAAIEFAVILPVFLGLTVATINLGYVFFVNHSMQRVAGETMRAVAYGDVGLADAKTFADAELAGLVGDFAVKVKLLPSGTEVEVSIVAQTDASNLIDFPLTNVALIAPEFAVSLTGKVITRFDPTI